MIGLIERLQGARDAASLLAWVQNDLASILPHGAFLCGIARRNDSGVTPVKLLSANMPADFLRTLKQTDGNVFPDAIQRWRDHGDALLVDARQLEAECAGSPWLLHCKQHGFTNAAVHGVEDYSRRYTSYFGFHRLAGPLDESCRRVLRFVVPPMHVTLQHAVHGLRAATGPAPHRSALTARELEVLSWVCEGKTSAEIAAILGAARSTVRNQTQSILVKLRVNTRAQAAAKAIRKGLVTPRNPDSVFGRA
jgi:transcriptional regulator EpsA